jgi:hypothetical protein
MSNTPNPKLRGAIPSPRHKLLAATPHRVLTAPPAQFGVVPKQIDIWGNDQYGDCVSAQEAYSIAAWSTQCGLPESFVTGSDCIAWARKHGFLNGAMLPDVMDARKKDGMPAGGFSCLCGPYSGVDYSNETVLKDALTKGPVNIAIDANALPSGAGNDNGWYATSGGNYPNTDHCVALTGYGPASYLYDLLGVQLPSGLPAATQGYLLFTWNTIGFVSHAWLMGTCTEAWVRTPTTVGQSPVTPPPPPPPPPPGPTPVPSGNTYTFMLAADGTMMFHPVVNNPLTITPQTTVQELIDAMTTKDPVTINIPPIILLLLQFVCPFAGAIPAPLGPILVAICGIIPHAALQSDGSKVVTIPNDLADKIEALKDTPQHVQPNEVGQVEAWLRSFPCCNCK